MPLSLYRRKGSDIWHYRGTIGPPGARRRLRGSTRTAVKADAERLVAEKDAREWKRGFDGPAAVTTFAQAAILYRNAQRPTRFIARLEDYWRDTPVKEITSGSIKQAAVALYPTAAGATRNRQVIVPTQAIINHAAEAELCQRIKVKRFPVEKKVREPATWTWVQDFMSASSTRLGALAAFMFLTGARISEALILKWEDIDFIGRCALIRSNKIKSERSANLPMPLVIALSNISHREGRVFGWKAEPEQAWHRAIKRAGIKQLSFHAMRHGFATAALRAGIDVVTVAKLGGWKSPAHVFATYGHASDDPTMTDRLVGDADVEANRKSRTG